MNLGVNKGWERGAMRKNSPYPHSSYANIINKKNQKKCEMSEYEVDFGSPSGLAYGLWGLLAIVLLLLMVFFTFGPMIRDGLALL